MTNSPYPTNSLPFWLRVLRKIDFPRKKGILNILFGSIVKKKPLGWTSTWNGIPWLIDPASHCHRWMIYDRYAESAFLKWAEKNVPKNGVIVDSGSNIGQFLPYYSKIVNEGIIYSFEPSNKLYKWIRECIKYNGIENIKVFNEGLGNKIMNARLEAPNDESVHGLWGRIVEIGGDESISITTLFDCLFNEKIESIDLWKLDVEGYEFMALEGALPFIKKRIIKAAYIEMSPTSQNSLNVHEFMIANGFAGWICGHSSIKRLQKFPAHKFDVLYILQ